MKSTIGMVFLLMAAIIYGSTLISASIYSEDALGWSFYYGVFGPHTLRAVGTYPAIILGLIGVILLLVEEIKK